MFQIKNIVSVFFAFYLWPVLGIGIRNNTEGNLTITCENENKYNNLDIRNVTGKWKAVEIYTHLKKDGVHKFESCPVSTIWETEDFPRSTFGPATENQLYHVQHLKAKFHKDYRHLRLLWDEDGNSVEYALFFRNDSAGYWQVYDGQNGTLVSRPNYQQFTGSVQVLKSVNNQLVLTFCQEPTEGRLPQLYTVLFSRDSGSMQRWEIESVHTLLQSKQLSVASRRMVCGNGADKSYYSITFSIFMCIFAFAIRS